MGCACHCSCQLCYPPKGPEYVKIYNVEEDKGPVSIEWVHSTTTTAAISLLDLARELRDMIYAYALVHPKSISVHIGRVHVVGQKITQLRQSSRARSDNSLALLRTCKQIHSEASQLFYGKNKFELLRCLNLPTDRRSATYSSYQPTLSITYTPFVRHFSLDYSEFGLSFDISTLWRHFVAESNEITKVFPNLKSLELTVPCKRTPRWDDLFLRPVGVTKEQQVVRVQKWIRTMAILDNSRMPAKVSIVLVWEKEKPSNYDTEAFEKALKLFQQRHH